ncbi:MAG TPA: hypothetical protein VFR94_11460 [Nitrososphaeraceae archaeon]|jgi:hypothetical protein|nr:hypothetical protein [Nitrososphaeraceae archaeon]
MNILILPVAETLLSKEEIDWIHKSIPGNEKVIADAIEFVVSHPETFVGILIGGFGFDDDKDIDYVIEVTEIDPEDLDYWQIRGEIGPTNYTADIVRRQKMEVENEDDEDNLSERRLLVGRVYL